MANEKKTSRKKFRVAVSGSTVDGREISPVHLREAAENFNPDVYAARVNVEHYLSPCPSSEFSAMGDVTALSTEDITEGPLAGRTALYAEIEPTERMKQLVADGKKIYSSIELHPQFSVNGRAYLVGLAMTDTPASLGTERLKFTAQQRQAVMTFNSIQGETPSFVYRYQMVMFVMDYAGELDDLTLPLLAWLSENQPQLLLNPERNQDIKFSAVINDDDSADLLFTLPLRERVRITRSSQGAPQAEHLQEPKPRLPSSEGDWSHVFQDVTWGESDG